MSSGMEVAVTPLTLRGHPGVYRAPRHVPHGCLFVSSHFSLQCDRIPLFFCGVSGKATYTKPAQRKNEAAGRAQPGTVIQEDAGRGRH